LQRTARTFPPDWLLALLLLGGVFLWQRTIFPLWMVDVFPQQLGAYFWKTGEIEWMYTPVARNAEWVLHRAPVAERLGAEGDPNTFLYPPFVAAALAPFAETPARLWRDVLFGLNCLVVFVLAAQILRLCEVQLRWRPYLWALALVLLTYPLARATKLGQIVPALAVLTWAGLLALKRGRETAGVALLAFVSAVKLFPLALAALPLLGGRLRVAIARSAAVIGVFTASLALLGLRVHQYWLEVMREFSGLVQPFFGNQAPLGWFVRVFYRRGWIDVIPFTTPLLSALKWAGLLLFLGGSLLLLWRLRERIFGDAFALSAGLLLSGVHLAMPVMWEHYWLFVLPTLGWALHDVWRRGDSRFWELWLAAAAFFFTMKLTHFYGDSVFGEIMSGSQTFGMALLWIWFVRRAWQVSANRSVEPMRGRHAHAA
jgi:hypothetical protein